MPPNLPLMNLTSLEAAIYAVAEAFRAANDSAWTDYTPVLTNISGGTQTYAKYKQIGKTVHVRWRYTLGGAGIAGLPTISLPVPAAATYQNVDAIGIGTFTDAGLSTNDAFVTLGSLTTVAMYAKTANGVYVSALTPSSIVPFTWGSGDQLMFEATYEAA